MREADCSRWRAGPPDFARVAPLAPTLRHRAICPQRPRDPRSRITVRCQTFHTGTGIRETYLPNTGKWANREYSNHSREQTSGCKSRGASGRSAAARLRSRPRSSSQPGRTTTARAEMRGAHPTRHGPAAAARCLVFQLFRQTNSSSGRRYALQSASWTLALRPLGPSGCHAATQAWRPARQRNSPALRPHGKLSIRPRRRKPQKHKARRTPGFA